MIALSHQVFLNKFHDSLIASFVHIQFNIINGNEKNVSIFHIHPINQSIILPIIDFSQNLFCKILRIVENKAFIVDQISISFKCFDASLIPSQKLLSFPSILL